MLYVPVQSPSQKQINNGLYIKCVLFLITSIIISGLVLLLLWMNGTLWPSTSITNYQYNATGIALTVILGLCGIVFNLWVCLCFLVLTSKPTFTQKSLETLVHSAVNDYNANMDSDEEIYKRGLEHFNKKRLKHRSINREQVIFAMKREELFHFIHERFMEAFPQLALSNPTWALNNVGGVYARQLLMLITFKEYICIWGTEFAQAGFSGFFPDLNEGDVVITGTLKSAEFNSKESIAITYVFGDTSLLKNGMGRHYTLSDNCYMISFGLHKHSKIWRVFYNGIIMPYLFQNGDTKSFMIQMGDAMRGMWQWVCYRIDGGE